MSTRHDTPNALTLDARFQFGKDKLLLTYQVKNPTDTDAYLMNRLYLTTPEWKITPDIIYVHFQPKTRTIWLNKMLADLPVDKLITSPVAPYVTPIRAGDVFREEVMIPMPLKEYRQYGDEIQVVANQIPREIFNEIYFSLQYYFRPIGTIENEKEISGTPVIVPQIPQGADLKFEVLESAHVKHDIQVEYRESSQENPK